MRIYPDSNNRSTSSKTTSDAKESPNKKANNIVTIGHCNYELASTSTGFLNGREVMVLKSVHNEKRAESAPIDVLIIEEVD